MFKLQSCNCKINIMKLQIENGTIYGRLKVLSEGEIIRTPSGQTNRTIRCLCECGNIKDIRVAHLTRGRTLSCGCIVQTMNGESHTDIGKLYLGIKSRCSSSHSERHLYYDKGVDMCKEWKDDFLKFKSFCLENGYKKNLQIDRKDGNKGYNPENCRFVTAKVNCNNRSNTYKVNYRGKERSLQMLLDELGNPNEPTTIRNRIKRGWSVERALFEKPSNNFSGRKTKMTKKKVIEIRELYKTGLTKVEIARKYNTSASNISLIVNRKTWKTI